MIRLREAYLRSPARQSELVELMIASASSFAVLFRHSLIALGEESPDSRRDSADRLAALLGFDAGAFHRVLDLREGKSNSEALGYQVTFAAYLDMLTRAADAIDRRFGGDF